MYVINRSEEKSGLTQKEAAELIGVPYRTYVRYEEESSNRDTYKYKIFLSELENKVRIDEEHGVLSLDAIKQGVVPILKHHNICYCYLFESKLMELLEKIVTLIY